MNFLKKTWFIALVVTLVLVVGVQYYIKAQGTEVSTLSANEIRSEIEEVYDGEIIAFNITGDTFEATLAKEGAEYELEGSAASGEVYSLIQTRETTIADASEPDEKENTNESADEKQINESPEEEETTNEQSKEETKPEEKPKAEPKKEAPKKEEEKPAKQKEKSSTRITSQEAGQIGLAQLPSGMVGEIDDIEFESSDQGGHYWVEIEIDDDDDDDIEFDEVTYKIHAITGDILLTEWDD